MVRDENDGIGSRMSHYEQKKLTMRLEKIYKGGVNMGWLE